MDGLMIDYREYLIDIVNKDDYRDFGPLLRYLFKKDYSWILPLDRDRAADGVFLRREFLESIGRDDENYHQWGVCSMFELILGVSYRIEFQIFGRDGYEDWPLDRIFWDLMKNIGFFDFDGEINDRDMDKIDDICELFCFKRGRGRYKYNIFTLETPKKGFEKMTIWDQMTIYVREKWPF